MPIKKKIQSPEISREREREREPF